MTALQPGAPVRCRCDHVFPVPAPRQLGATALRCTGCGGLVGTQGRSCPYCGAELSRRDRRSTTLCPACCTRIADGARHCHACGVPIAPQALTPVPGGASCPRCRDAPTELRVRSLGEAHVVECATCAGLWVTVRVFSALCRDAERRVESSLRSPGPPAPDARVRYVPCLWCGSWMARKQFRYAGRASGVVADVCAGHGLWFDADELERAVAFVQTNASVGAEGDPVATALEGLGAPVPAVSAPLPQAEASPEEASLEHDPTSDIERLRGRLEWF